MNLERRLPRVAVVGIGGVGGIIAASLLSAAKAAVTLVCRPGKVEALRSNGITVHMHENKSFNFPLKKEQVLCSEQAANRNGDGDGGKCAAGITLNHKNQDFILVAVKAHQLPDALDTILGLVGPNTTIVPCINGLPWWFFHPEVLAGAEGKRLISTDPTSRLSAEISTKSILGCVGFVSGKQGDEVGSYISSWPKERNKLIVGDPTLREGEVDVRAHSLASLFDTNKDSDVPVTIEISNGLIRSEIFDKLLINCSINTIGALGRASCGQTVDEAPELLCALVEEATAIAQSLDPPLILTNTGGFILDLYRGQSSLQSSMLTDVINGRSTEKDFIVGPLIELARMQGVLAPRLETVARLMTILEKSATKI